MSKYIIKGGKKLQGSVKISGSKNAALPIIAGTILNKGISTLYNVPDISDTQMMYEILKQIGAKIVKFKNKVIIDTREISIYEIPHELMRKMRSSVIIAGALIGKYKKCKFSYPGGCDIGARPIDLHLKAFSKLGINVDKNYGNIECECKEIIGDKIDLEFPSVGATENIILSSVLGKGVTTITNAAREPEIIDLQKFLNKMGANIEGAGTDIIKIVGVHKLKNVSYNIMPDRIEAATFLCIAAATSSQLTIEQIEPSHLTPIIHKLEEMGCELEIEKRLIKIKGPKKLKAVDIKTMPYPGFPTDMQSILAATLTIAKGTSIVIENIFENRFRYTQELVTMGAKISIQGKSAVIKGVRRLYGAKVVATDLRGGAALVIAGLVAKTETVIDNNRYILRGYDKIDKKLQAIGANIREE